ncbi:MAG: glycosyltransferase [Planctomycetota bacterium]
MRLAIFTKNFPSDAEPGAGLREYYQCLHAEEEILIFVRRGAHKPVENPRVRIHCVPTLNAHLHADFGLPRKAWAFFVKALGLLLYGASALGPALRFRPEVVLVTQLELLGLAFLCRLFCASKVVMGIYGTNVTKITRWRTVRFFLGRVADRILYVDPTLEGRLSALFGADRIFNSLCGVDGRLYEGLGGRGWDARDNAVLVLSKFRKGKDVVRLLEMAGPVASRHNAACRVIGYGYESGEVEAYVRRHPDIELVGPVPYEEVPRRVEACRAVLSYSPFEGLPKTMLEAIACRTPFVFTDVGACRLVGERFGRIVPYGDEAGFRNAVEELLSSRETWERFHNPDRGDFFRTFEWKTIFARERKVYEALLRHEG